MSLPERMSFGIFLAPFHWVEENPTLGLERDLELLQWLDKLTFDNKDFDFKEFENEDNKIEKLDFRKE